MLERYELKKHAKEQLRGNWGIAVLTFFVYNLILNGFNYTETYGSFIGINLNLEYQQNILNLIFGGVLSVGISRFSLNMATRKEEAKFKNLFSYFNIFFKTLGLWLIMGVMIAIGFILLVIPGIILALMFSQAMFILAEDNDKGILECLGESSEMMKGYKFDYLILWLSFVGWTIVGFLSFGVGFLWIIPYQNLTDANFYLELKRINGSNEVDNDVYQGINTSDKTIY